MTVAKLLLLYECSYKVTFHFRDSLGSWHSLYNGEKEGRATIVLSIKYRYLVTAKDIVTFSF